MDYQRDYILRLIHMLGELMRRIYERLDNRQRLDLLDQACREHCGMPLATAESLTMDSLYSLLSPMPRFMLGELLAVKAEVIPLAAGEAEALQYRAVQLLSSLYDETQLCDLRAEKLRQLKQAVLPMLTANDLMACARFFFTAERYDEMEDALFQALALETGDAFAQDRETTVLMLRRASKATARALALCNMSGDELRASAHELTNLQNPHEREKPQ
ncbi:MAG: DUF6483 family protein [Eubacteriales bacterium]|nr:DUF6483 family protein [Eubacteriales bacterium]